MSEGEGLIDPAPAERPKRSKLLTVCPYILGNEFCERLAFYGLSANLSIYLIEVMGLSVSEASVQVSLFTGTAYLTPLLGAWLADGYWGRFRTILVFSSIYAVGMFWMAATAAVPGWAPAAPTHSRPIHFILLYGALYTVAIGTGGIKPNVSSFGADQFDDKVRAERKQKQSFFNWFYFSINVGSLLACTVIVYIQERNWGVGFAIPAVAMALAVAFFIAGYRKYTHQPIKGSPLERLTYLCYGATLEFFSSLGRRRQQQSAAEYARIASNGGEDPAGQPFPTALAAAQDAAPAADALERAGAKQGLGHTQIEEVRMVLRMAPIFLLTILYWTIYSQMASVFVIQAKYMDRDFDVGGRKYVMPAASMTMFDTFAIIIMIPIYDGIVVPLLKRVRCQLSLLQRIGWGFVLAAAAMLAAAVVERRRMTAIVEHGSNIGVMQQVTPYVLVGGSEVLSSIGQIEFFYDQAPDVMRSCCSALALVATALGGYISAAILVAVGGYTDWLDDLEHGASRLDLYFVLLAGVMLLNTVVFALVAMRYRYKEVPHRAPMPRIGGQHGAQPQPVRGVQRPPSESIPIGGQRPAPGMGYQYAGTPSTPDVGPYGRSVTYAPATPMLPAHFR